MRAIPAGGPDHDPNRWRVLLAALAVVVRVSGLMQRYGLLTEPLDVTPMVLPG